jgi:hypothetical protein
MTINNSIFKAIILADLLVNLHTSRRPIDARFAQAHLALTGIEIFIKKNSLITLITDTDADSHYVSANDNIRSICEAITETVGANYVTDVTAASAEDIVHLVLDCTEYESVVTCLTTLLNRTVNYSAVVQLVNCNSIHPDTYNLLNIVIDELMLNGKPLTSVFFINTLNENQLNQMESPFADKLISQGFMLKGDSHE